jgi:hypothetical protein
MCVVDVGDFKILKRSTDGKCVTTIPGDVLVHGTWYASVTERHTRMKDRTRRAHNRFASLYEAAADGGETKLLFFKHLKISASSKKEWKQI